MRNSYGYENYRGRSRLQTALSVLAVILLVVLLLAVAFFFFAQQYIVYDEDGKAHLELPVLRQEEATPTPDPTQGPLLVVETPAPTPTPEPEPPFTAVTLPLSALIDGTVAEQVQALSATAAILVMKDEEGYLAYPSTQAMALGAGVASADPDIEDAIRTLTGGELHTVAKISCFRDLNTVYYYGRQNGLRSGESANWRDSGHYRWFSPAAQGARDYIIGVCTELCQLGFDELLLDYCTFPTTGNLNKIITGARYDPNTLEQDLEEFYAQLRTALEAYPNVKLSLMAVPQALAAQGSNPSGQTPQLLAAYADKVYLPQQPEGADWSAALTLLTDAGVELVYPAGAAPQDGATWTD